MNIIKGIFGFQGRVGRASFTLFLLFFFIGSIAFNLAILLLVGMRGEFALLDIIQEEPVFYTSLLIALVIYLIIKYSYLTRRVHDFNKKPTESKLYNTILLLDITSFLLIIYYLNMQSKINYDLIEQYHSLMFSRIQSDMEQAEYLFMSSNELRDSLSLLTNSGGVIIIYMLILGLSYCCVVSLSFLKGNDGENDFGKPQVPFWKKTNS
ncbi:DUF805 domain-containing protein [Mannheimia indoligenes]|uniref:DUF805 domain-containing protein n=1 Tax=Mannheimia indoligenes TaxID=3103145 RepID=A0ABU7ZG18_9PAST